MNVTIVDILRGKAYILLKDKRQCWFNIAKSVLENEYNEQKKTLMVDIFEEDNDKYKL